MVIADGLPQLRDGSLFLSAQPCSSDSPLQAARQKMAICCPGQPWGLRLLQTVLGLVSVGLMMAIFRRIAFGPGMRNFKCSGVPIPGLQAGESVDRAALGVGAAFMGVFLVVLAIVGARPILRARSSRLGRSSPTFQRRARSRVLAAAPRRSSSLNGDDLREAARSSS